MKSSRIRTLALSVMAVSALAGCGGGDGDSTTAPAPAPGVTGYPTSGTYGYTVKASGPTSALRHGLSLLHPAMPENEYVIETATSAITDTRLIVRGDVNAAQSTAANLQPYALFYIFGGDVRSVRLQADGTQPRLQIRRSDTSTACRFLLAANDHVQPDNSRFVVSTAGADGTCGTADDRWAEVRNGSGLSLVLQPLAERPLEVSRDPATLAPRGWIYARDVQLWGGGTLTLRPAGSLALTQVLASTPHSALVSDGTRLSVISFTGATATAPATETPLDAALTIGTNWRLIGFDADHFYVYDDDPTYVFTSPWRVLRISKANPTAVSIGSGNGVISVASLGVNVVYLTVFQATSNVLVRFPKTGGMRVESPYPITTKPTVQTSAAGRHLKWEVSGVGSANVSYRIDMIDEAGTPLQQWPTGAFPISMADAGAENFNLSENRTRFLIAQGFDTRAFSNASLIGYDAATGTARTLGTLPAYGNDVVFATASGGPGSFGAGFATRSSGGSYVEQDARVFSYDIGTADSLRTANRR